MPRIPSLFAAILLLVCSAAHGNTPPSWHVGQTTFRYEASARRLTATCGGVTFEPLSGITPIMLWNGKPCQPQQVKVTHLLTINDKDDAITCHYHASLVQDPAHGFDYSLRIESGGDGLNLKFSAASTQVCQLYSGQTLGLKNWRRFTYMRNGEAYGQPFWPRVAWSPEQNVYVSAVWDMAQSHGAMWESRDARFQGDGAFAAAMDVAYHPLTNGVRRNLQESLKLRVGANLWSVAAPPGQAASPFASELARCVFVDIWGGTAPQAVAFLQHLSKLTLGSQRFYTVMEDWETGGFDALLPDSIRMPDYPPNEGIGTVNELAQLSTVAKTMGRFALRTNYMVVRPQSPSVLEGKTAPGTGDDGKPTWHTRPSDWHKLATRQEDEIHRLFQTNAGFTDQLTSAAAPWGYLESDPGVPEAGSMGEALRLQRLLATDITNRTHGPLGSETNMDEQLLGQWVSTGDFGIFNGYNRAFTPEFKLRRIHHLSTFHGMGLMYRYFEMPPFKNFSAGTTSYLQDPQQYDDYRAAEVLFGNGGYLFYYPGMPWDYVMTECVMIGSLQKRYALQPVQSVDYWLDGRWQPLQAVLRAGINPTPDPFAAQQPVCLKRIRVIYRNGLHVVVNRLPDPFDVDVAGMRLVLPRSGWAAWNANGRFLAYSAYRPGTTSRVDYMRDLDSGMQYLNPRGLQILNTDRPTVWRNGVKVVSLDPGTGDAIINNRRVEYRPPVRTPVSRIDFVFKEDARGWRAASCLGPARILDGRLTAQIVGDDPYFLGPPVDLAPDSVKTIVVRMKVTCGTFGQFYFVADGVKASAEEMCVHFPVQPGPQVQEFRIPVGDHPLWRGHRITSIRLDPEHGAFPGLVSIESIRGE